MRLCFDATCATAGSLLPEPPALPGWLVGEGLPALLRVLLAVRPANDRDQEEQAFAADWESVRETLNGSGRAYERLVDRYQEPIAAYMWRFTRDRRQWEELVQDVFVEAYFSLKSYRGRAPLLHWLKRLATRVGYRFWRSRRGRHAIPLPAVAELDLPSIDNFEAIQQTAEIVHWLLARLAPRDRLVLTLIYLEECSVREVAQLTGWTEAMVKVQSHRARHRLKKICREMGVEP